MAQKNRTERLRIRLRPREREAISEAADQLGKTDSEFTREAILDAVRRVRESGTGPIVGPWRADVHERAET